MNNHSSFVDLLYEIAPDSRYWSNIVSDLEKVALTSIKSDTVPAEDTNPDPAQQEISEAHKETLHSILPHLQRVLSIQKKLAHLEQQRDLATSLLESMPMGIVVVDDLDKIVSLNRVAKKMCDNSHIVHARNGEFFIEDRKFSAFLFEKKSQKNLTGDDSIHAIVQSESEELSVLVTGSRLEKHSIVFLSDEKGRQHISHNSLQQLFPISKTEAELCVHLVHGLSSEEIAQERQTSVQTIRTQFKNIFRKTRTNGQVQLVRKILTSLARISPEDHYTARVSYAYADNYADPSKIFTLKNGRNIGYAEHGNPDGYPFVFCHSMFGSRFEYPLTHGLEQCRVIIPERPGYGLSDAQAGGNYASWVKDLEALLDHLEISEFAIGGLSVGAAYASAVASILSDRVSHLSIINFTPQVTSWNELKYISANLKFFAAFFLYMPSLGKYLFEKEALRLRNKPKKLVERITENHVDKALLLSDDVFPIIKKNYAESLKDELGHVTKEFMIHAHDWGFSMANIGCPVDIWSGELDSHAPLILVEKTTREIPGKRIHRIPNKGHFLYYDHWPEIVATIMANKTTNRRVCG